MTLTIVFLACAVLAPLLTHIRQWPPAALFAVAALVYAIFGGISFANVQITLGNIQETEPQVYRDTYYVVNRGHVSMNLGIIMAFFAAVIWLQTRFGAMLYPRITKTLFWILQLGLLGASSFSLILTTFITPPRRYVEYSEYLETFNLISTSASLASTIAGLGLICVLIWSVIFRRNAA